MVTNFFPDFLNDPEQYAGSERYWADLWDQLDPYARSTALWKHPWLGTGSPQIKDGNPIFSAISPILRRGIRVIQQEPVETGLDIQVWLDTFGGGITDPDRVHELVISCVLSDLTSNVVVSLMTPWVRGQALQFENTERGTLLPVAFRRPKRRTNSFDFAA